MIKKRKDSGFTLIELMIVIAVIGILAVVMIPKVGTIKTQSKTAGLDTNIRLVQGYVQSRITDWAQASATPTTVASEVYGAVMNGSDPMKNPINPSATGSSIFNSTDGEGTAAMGKVYITTTTSPTYSIAITAVDSNLAPYKTVTVTP